MAVPNVTTNITLSCHLQFESSPEVSDENLFTTTHKQAQPKPQKQHHPQPHYYQPEISKAPAEKEEGQP